MNEEAISFRLEVFEGPLDLLLSLISKNKIDIYDIPIAEIFGQYMDYVEKLQMLDMDIASDFIVMASGLMLIKSRMLLPKQVVDGVEVDPREELVRTLIEYRRAKEEAVFLGGRFSLYFGRYTKESEEIGVDKNYVADQQTEYLLKAFERIIARIKSDEDARNDDAQVTLNHIITKKPTPVHVREEQIMLLMSEKREMLFEELMLTSRDRSELVASFMALLQLIAAQKVLAVFEEGREPVIKLAAGQPT